MSTDFQPDFYVTCATAIPVLFVFIAVEKGPYDAFMRAWQKTEEASIDAQQITLSVTQTLLKALGTIIPPAEHDTLAGQSATTEPAVAAAAPPKHWKRTLAKGAAVGASVISPFLALVPIAILLAGTVGEGVAVYALYQQSEQLWERKLVLIATIFMAAAAAAWPLLAYIRYFLKSFSLGLKAEVRTMQAYFSFLKEWVSLLESALKQQSSNKKKTDEE